VSDTIIESYELYAALIRHPQTSFHCQECLCRSLDSLIEKKFRWEENLNAANLAHLGKLLRESIHSFQGRLARVPLAEWLRVVVDISLKLVTLRYVHISAQAALEGFKALFPMPEEYAQMTLKAFMEIFERAEAEALKCKLVSILEVIWERTDRRGEMFLICQPVYSSEFGEPLITVMLEQEIDFADSEQARAVQCYEEIGRKFEQFQAKCQEAVEKLTDRAGTDD
jgi:hypothetical protein